MAIEEFKDDDKNRKYRIRINEYGEEELEIINPEDEEEDEQERAVEAGADFEVPEFTEDDESVTGLTPEQLYIERMRREQEREKASADAMELIEKAAALFKEGKTEYALISLDSAQKTFEEQAEIYPLKLEVLTKKYTDFSRIDECLTLTDNYTKYVSAENKAEYSDKHAKKLLAEIERVQAQNESIHEENEQKKAERRVRFKERFKRTLRNFFFAFIPFIVLLAIGIGFSTVMFSVDTGELFVVTIVFFALAFIMFIVSILLARPLAREIMHLYVNERDSSTALGRTYLDGLEFYDKLGVLYDTILYKKEEEKSEDADVSTEENADEKKAESTE